MCTERRWRWADLRLYLFDHPVVGRLCRSLVWLADGGERAITFRPLGDGTLTSLGDEAVTLSEEASVRLAHPLSLEPETITGWLAHLRDYELEPPFDQLGPAPYRLPEAARGQTKLRDFEGHLVQAFKLRAHATRLGYVRGSSEDGGYFFFYRRSYPGLGLEARLEFSGNQLPEENRTVALLAIEVVRTGPEDGPPEAVALEELPPALVSACYNDLQAIAAAGTGFDPDWTSKTQS
jgi:hypothetical protein